MKQWTIILCVTFVLIKLNGINGHYSHHTYVDNNYGHNGHHFGKQNGASPLFVKTIVNLLRFLSAHPKLVQKTHPAVIVDLLKHLSSKPALLAAVPQPDLENFMNLVFGTPNLINNIPESLLISLISSATVTSPGLFGLNQQPISDFSPYYTYIGDYPTNQQPESIAFVPLPPPVQSHQPQTPVIHRCSPPKTSVVPGVSVVKEVGVSVTPQSGPVGGVQAVADVAAGVSLPTVGGILAPPQTPAVSGVYVAEEVGVSAVPQTAGPVGGVQAVAEVAAGVSLPTAGGIPAPPQTPAVSGVSVVKEVGVSAVPQTAGPVGGVQAVADVAAGVYLPTGGGVPAPPQTPAVSGVYVAEEVGISAVPQTAGPVGGAQAVADVAAGVYLPTAGGVPAPPQTPVAPCVPQTSAVPCVSQSPPVPSRCVPQTVAQPCVPQTPRPVAPEPATPGTGTVVDVEMANVIKTNALKLLIDAISRGKPIIPITTVHDKLAPIIQKFHTTGTALHQHKQLLHQKLTEFLNKHHSAAQPGKHLQY